jgi:putative DNA primase/helicase
MNNPIQQFQNDMRQRGIEPPDVINDDGKINRFGRKKKGWYVYHGDGIPAGCYGDWSLGEAKIWRADIGRELSATEDQAHRERMAVMRREREAEEAKQRTEAATLATARWEAAQPADDHSYLKNKGVKSYGLRVENDRLIIPLRDGDAIYSLQFISAKGDKLFLTGGRKKGCCFTIGTIEAASVICIAEGYSTGATIHEATGYPVVIAFDAGNLQAVAKKIRKQYPDALLIFCADDDYHTEGNTGITKATEASKVVGGLLAIPDFGTNRPEGATDFNDMVAHCGIDAVKQSIIGIIPNTEGVLINSHVTDVTGVATNNDGACAVTPEQITSVTDVTENGGLSIPDSARPCFKVFDEPTSIVEHGKLRSGVWHFGVTQSKKANEPPTLTNNWICSPLYIEAVTSDGQHNNFGRMLRFKNTLGKWRTWAMPMELLRAGGDDLRGELLAMGVHIDPSAHALLGRYLQAITPSRRVHCALQVGWSGDSFVLPDEVIGANASGVIFQSGERTHDEYTTAGTLAGWQAGIAARAVGNPLLMIALASSFAGAILKKCNAEGGGIHFVGDSSTGKTTAIEAACATWGGGNYKRSWRSTSNGMEGAAAMFNDSLLALDEISECDPKEVGAIVYALGNGRGKQRASRSGSARSVTRWLCFVLSSGERTISTTMLEGGHRAKAGQSVRLLDIPAARKYGAWDKLHEFETGTAFSDSIKQVAATHHGHAGRAFLQKLTRDQGNFNDSLERFKALSQFSADGGEGQDKRAAGRFALLALAGELATEYGVTGWPEGAAIEAAGIAFQSWRGNRGTGNDERRQIVDRVSSFIERNGDARFSSADNNTDTPVRDRAGWWCDGDDGRVFLFNSDGLKEALKGFDFKRALDVLQEVGALPKSNSSGERAKAQRIGGRMVKVYAIQADKLGGDHGA